MSFETKPKKVQRSCFQQCKSLSIKNLTIQRRRPGLTLAEYFVVVCYMLFYYKLLYVIFPDARYTSSEIAEMAQNLTKAIPNSCMYLALDKVGFIGDDADKLMNAMYYDCGMPWNETKYNMVHFKTDATFTTAYDENPMEWYAGIGNIKPGSTTTKSTFTIFHNETMSGGRYVPNFDEDTLEQLKPTFVFVPVLTDKGMSMNYGDNRLADLQYRAQNAMTKIVLGEWDSAAHPTKSMLYSHSISAKSFPFEKPQCDGAGCVMKYMIPQIVAWVYMITLQSLLTSLGQEKERSIKESLLLSGMSQWSYFGSWIFSKSMDAILPALVWTAGAYVLQCIQYQYFMPVLLVTLCYGLQMICFSLFVQTFFKTSQAMFMGTLLLLMVFSLIYYPVRLLGFDKDPSAVDHDALTITFLFPAVSICHYYWELVEAEGMKMLLDYDDNYVMRAIWMQIVSAFFWLFMFMYFEQIMPQAHGPAHQSHKCFCFGCSDTSSNKVVQDEKNGNDVEMVAAAKENDEGKIYMGISVRNLVMEFKVNKETKEAKEAKEAKGAKGAKEEGETKEATKGKAAATKKLRAVDDLCVDFPQGSITAVLGHNGAGKTTSIRCITGSLTPTSGSVMINGRDVLSSAANMEWLRANVGVCPQHDVLYDELSAREHVILFASMRGLTASLVEGAADGTESIVEECLSGVDMLGKADELIRTFSGGQKRRLSVALALLGAPTVVILDEPTTGMDVITRQSVWKSIQRLKGKATIILTTHAMEEADALGDRIVVLSHGKVQAQGSSLDLKKKYGVGFHLHVVTQQKRKKQEQLALEDGEDGGNQQEASAPGNADIIGEFDADALMNTLKTHVEESDKVTLLTNVGTECSLTLPAETSKFPALFTELEEKKEELGINQLALSMTTLEEVFLKLGELDDEEKKENDNADKVDDEKKSEEIAVGVNKEKVKEVAASPGGSWSQQVRGVALLNIYSKKRNPSAPCFLCIQPIMFVIIAGIIYVTTGGENFVADPVVPFETKDPVPPSRLAWGSANMTGKDDLAVHLSSQILNEPAFEFVYESQPLMETALRKGDIGQGDVDSKKYVEFAVGVEQQWDATISPTEITLLTSSTSRSLREMFAATQSAWALSQQRETRVKSDAAKDDDNYMLSIPTYQQLRKGKTAKINTAQWSSGGIMVLAALPIAFMSALYGERLVRDRVGGMRVHLFVSSLRRVQYYAGNFIVDFMLYLPVAILTPVLLVAFGFEGVLKTNLWSFFWVFLFTGPVVIGFGYLLSWIFSSVQAAQEWFGELINFSMTIPFLITSFVILDTSELGHTLAGIVPGYALYRGMGVIEGEASGGQPYLTWDDIFDSNRSLLWVIVVLIIDAFFYWGMVMVVETIEARCSRCRDSCILKCKGTGDKVVGGGGSNIGAIMERKPDPRVQEEIDRITKATANGAGAVDMVGADADMLIANMSKTFVMSDGRLNEAVKDVCLGVKRGTVFGLLGMNGAGKTTLLHAIQGKHQASDGDCFIADPGADNKTLSCKHDVDRVRQLFGICPQHEVLWEYVTPREHLRAFANIRGVPAEAIETVVEDLLTRLDLLEKAEEPSAKLSGGMKRRLSIAMSVIGSPKCVFLDEPTTGLDPNTRRFVWDYILEIKEGRIVVLTTHSMEEADALCTNIGIMVNGSLLSLGTPQQLKSMHGSGYRVTVRLKDDATTTEDETDPLRVALEEKYNTKEGEEQEEQDSATVEYVATSSTKTTRVFAIAATNLSLGGLFQLLEDQKEDLGIIDYSVSQTTMEQVFTKFAQFQKDDTRAD